MLRFVIRRLLALPVVILMVTLVLFLLILRLPAEQRVMIYVPSVNPHMSEEEWERMLQKIIEQRGLDDPAPVQYVRWLKDLVAGEWGYSPTWRQTVLEGLKQRAPATLELALFAMIPAIMLALVLGGMAARFDRRLPDHLLRAGAFVAWAFPPFILALILMNIFYAWLGWFPPERLSIWARPVVASDEFQTYTGLMTVDALLNGNLAIFWDAIRHLVLPAITLGLAVWALLARLMRSSLLDVLRQDYITTARAKGVSEQAVVSRHARRNAVLPVITAGGVAMSMLISGVVVVEVVFNYNGVGRWAVEALIQADVPVTMGFAFFGCTVTVLASLLADILYAVVDPRVTLF